MIDGLTRYNIKMIITQIQDYNFFYISACIIIDPSNDLKPS